MIPTPPLPAPLPAAYLAAVRADAARLRHTLTRLEALRAGTRPQPRKERAQRERTADAIQ